MPKSMARARRIAAALLLFILLCTTGCKASAPDASDAASAPQTDAQTPAQTDFSTITNSQSALPAAGQGTLSVLFINVGRADAALVQYQGKSVLIDTGTEESQPLLFGALSTMGVAGLDALILTHTHADHIGGMRGVLRYLNVNAAYRAEISEMKKKGGNKIDERAAEAEVPLTLLAAGDAIPLADNVSFEVIGPLVENKDDDNDNSLVLRLVCNGRTLLFTGDMQFAEEETLLQSGASLKADVLKVGNHGNPDATSGAFGQAVAPKIAFIPTNTQEDANSANARVLAALGASEVHITQDYAVGALLLIAPDGTMQVKDVPRPAAADASLQISFARDTQAATIQNAGSASCSLAGYVLYSARGGEVFRFPESAAIAAGASVTVGAAGGSSDYAFVGEDSVWHESKDDTAILYDLYGNERSRFAG